MNGAFYQAFKGKRVLVTGHTGFKGSWLCEWLLALGAEVTGYALPCPQPPALFDQLQLTPRVRSIIGDIRDAGFLKTTVLECQPDYVFHLAAQPLVRASYSVPVETFEVNVIGTVHLLEALRSLTSPCAAIFITTDKCYANREWLYGYREEDPLGGHDPYSASKAAAEIVIASYRQSFFTNHSVKVASARAGNVIGGGDWALDRIIPDAVRALANGDPIGVRNAGATRPWQHVLEPLSGYLWLGAKLLSSTEGNLAGAFNFGPTCDADRTVKELIFEVLRHWPGNWVDQSNASAPHEAGRLQLTIDKARALLAWVPVWRFEEAVAATISWYRYSNENPHSERIQAFTQQQIAEYTSRASALQLPWTVPFST